MNTADELKGKSVFVLGLGISGRSAARYLLAKGCTVWASDDQWETIQHQAEIESLQSIGLKVCTSQILPEVELLVLSPGVPQNHPLCLAAGERGVAITGEAELALNSLAEAYTCVAITGTNGKTTVTFLIEHLLNSCGIKAKALGNSGTPLTSVLLLKEKYPPDTVVVVELSSYQLETLHRPVFDAAVLLNITEDHLDRYASFRDYAQAKIHLFNCVKPGGKCYVEETCYADFKEQLEAYAVRTYGHQPSGFLHVQGRVLFAGDSKFTLPNIPLTQSGHDLENVLAAYAIAAHFAPPEKILNALASFKKPFHRLEFVRELQGITFIDDSKATNVDAVTRAVESISTPIILIAGGVDKGGSYKCWLKAFEGKVRAICLVGQAAGKIEQDLNQQFPIYHFKEFYEAVASAAALANPNETVLLSPGCSSYDMFSSYVHRGKVFQEIVHALDIKDNL